MNSITLFIKFEFPNIKHFYKYKCFVIFKKKNWFRNKIIRIHNLIFAINYWILLFFFFVIYAIYLKKKILNINNVIIKY